MCVNKPARPFHIPHSCCNLILLFANDLEIPNALLWFGWFQYLADNKHEYIILRISDSKFQFESNRALWKCAILMVFFCVVVVVYHPNDEQIFRSINFCFTIAEYKWFNDAITKPQVIIYCILCERWEFTCVWLWKLNSRLICGCCKMPWDSLFLFHRNIPMHIHRLNSQFRKRTIKTNERRRQKRRRRNKFMQTIKYIVRPWWIVHCQHNSIGGPMIEAQKKKEEKINATKSELKHNTK